MVIATPKPNEQADDYQASDLISGQASVKLCFRAKVLGPEAINCVKNQVKLDPVAGE